MEKLAAIVNKITEKEISPSQCAMIFLALLTLRNFIEQFVALSLPITFQESVIELLHNLYFFLLAYILIWIFLSFVLKLKPQKLAFLMTGAFFLMLVPPIVDMIKTGGEIFWSFYLLGGPKDLARYFISVFGNLPSGIVYFGTRITFLAAIGLISIFVFLKTRNWGKAALSGLGTYLILFFMGAFPSIFFFFYNFFSGKIKILDIQGFHVVQLFGAPGKVLGVAFESIRYSFAWKLDLIYFPFLVCLLGVLFYLINREKFWAMLKNLRFPQLFYHSGLFFIGIGLGYLSYSQNFALNIFSFSAAGTLLISIWLAWASSVVMNDIYDFGIDSISNPERPLPQKIFNVKEYAELGVILFLLSLLGAITIGFPFAVLILVYTILAYFYSNPPFRLKKFPLVATLISSLALIMILFLGYILMSGDQTIHSLPWRITLLLLITYTISLPIKDFKDIKGDKRYGIWTIPVIFGEKRARLMVAINIFISYILSVFFLNELKLFWWAMLFGTLTFLVVVSPKIKPRRLFWPVLGLVSSYGLILVKIVFMQN